MPVYEYMCEKCEKVTESLRRMSDADQTMICEHCGSDKTHRTHSVFAAQAGGSESMPSMGGPCGCGAKHSCGMGP
jgi:putative FmdB family regulatory protein